MKREDMFGNVEILLFDILQELKKLNEPKTTSGYVPEIKEENKQYPCKACGGVHENRGQLLACARKHKKDGVK